MRVANIILCHKNPSFVARLINAMNHECFDFYVHVDKKATLGEFAGLADLPRTRLVKKNIKVQWASYSFIRAILNSMEEILHSGERYEFINVLTGQDYPLKPPQVFYNFLQKNSGKSFIRVETPPSLWWDDAFQRFTKYHMTNYHIKGKTRVEQLLNIILPERKFPLPYALYGGPHGAHWTISTEAAKYVYDFLNDNKKIRSFFKYTWGADEFLTTSIIMNHADLKEKAVNDNLRYIDWSLGGARPKILTVDDLPHLLETPAFFARKFDPLIDANILDLIDKEIVHKIERKEKLRKAI